MKISWHRVVVLLIVVIGLVSCGAFSNTRTYIDEKYGFTFEYPHSWEIAYLSDNFISIQWVTQNHVEAEIGILILDPPTSLDPLVFLDEILQNSIVGSLSPSKITIVSETPSPDSIVISQEPHLIQHNGYDGASARIKFNGLATLQVSEDEAIIVKMHDSTDILTIKNGNRIIIIYIFGTSLDERAEEQTSIVKSFSFTSSE